MTLPKDLVFIHFARKIDKKSQTCDWCGPQLEDVEIYWVAWGKARHDGWSISHVCKKCINEYKSGV